MKRLALRTAATLAGIAAVAGIAVAAEPSVRETMKARHDHYHDLGDAFKTIRDEVRDGSPDMSEVKSAAQLVKQASVDQFKWFPKGSGPDSGFKTRAKAEIWTDPKAFEAAQKNFASAAPKLVALAEANDIRGLQQQFKIVGKACADCHDQFRAEEDHEH